MAVIVKKPIQISFRDLCGIINLAPVIKSGFGPIRVKEIADMAPGENVVIHTGSSVLKFTDGNSTDIHKASFAPLAGGYLGSFSLSPVNQAANNVKWTFKVSDATIDHLQEGETLTQKYKITINDGHGGKAIKVVTVVIVGTNDVPELKCPDHNDDARVALVDSIDPDCDFAGDVTEDNVVAPSTTLTDTGSFKFDDVDLKDTHTITVLPSGNQGTLTAVLSDTATGIGDGTVTWNYSIDNSLVQDLDDNETRTETFNIQIDDGHGGIVVQPVTVTIHGVNDAPVANPDTNWVKEDSDTTATGNVLVTTDHTTGAPSGTFGDQADTDVDVEPLSVTPASIDGQYGHLDLGANGAYTYSLYTELERPAAFALVQGLTDGETLLETFNYTVSDGTASNTATLNITVFGTDDGVSITDLTPEVDGGDAIVDEDDLPAGSDTAKEPLTTTGTFTISAPDGINNLTVGTANVIIGGVFAPVSITTPLGNTLSFTAFNPATGEVNYTYTLLAAETHPTANGENDLFEDFTVTLTDTDPVPDVITATLSIKIVDDLPTAINDDAGPIAEDAPFTFNVLTNDVKGADLPVDVVAASLATGSGIVTFDPNGDVTFDPDPGFAGAVEINYTIRDADGDESIAVLKLDVNPDSVPAVSVVYSATGDGVVWESALPDGSGGGDLTETGSLNITHSGTDTTALIEVRDGGGSWIPVLADGTVVSGLYGDITVNLDGTWSYTLADNTLTHTNPLGVGAADQRFENFATRVTDSDGDMTDADGVQASETITIAVNDDGPTAVDDIDCVTAAAPQVLNFDDVVLGEGGEQPIPANYGGFTWTQTGVYNPNGAVPGYVPSSGQNLAFFAEAIIGANVPGYPGNAGDPLSASDGLFSFIGASFVSAFDSSLLITAEAFSNNVSLGTYTFTAYFGSPVFVDFTNLAQFANVDRIEFDAANYFGFDDFTTRGTSPAATGNVVTSVDGGLGSDANGTDGVADTAGADGIASIVWTGQSGTTVAGLYGTLTVNGSGDYSYVLNNTNSDVIALSSDEFLFENFVYIITDGDGDTAQATLEIKVVGSDDPVRITGLTPAANGGELTIDEDDLPNGSSPDAGALTQTGSFTVTAVDGFDDLVIGGTLVITNGAPSNIGLPITTSYGTLTITGVNLATGVVDYSYTLSANTLAHGPADDGQDFVLDNIAVSLTDVDGSSANSTLVVKVIDDVPAAFSVNNSNLTDDEVKGPFAVNSNEGEATPLGTDADVAGSPVSASGPPNTLFVAGADGLQSVAITNPAGVQAIYKLASGAPAQETLSYSSTPLVGGGVTLTATGAISTNPVFTLTINADGSYLFTQQAALVHPLFNPSNEDDLAIPFNFTVTDKDGDTSAATLTINVDDDTPVGTSVSASGAEASASTNLMLIVDTSGSIDNAEFATIKQAMIDLINAYVANADVAVRIVTFATGASAVGATWMSAADAIAAINGLPTPTGSTNYDAALATAQAAFASGGKLAGGQNVSYFMSDGAPNPASAGIDGTEENAWEQFLRDEDIVSFGLGITTGAQQAPINPVAYNGVTEVDTDAVLITDLSQLSGVLVGNATSVIATGTVNGSYGADGGTMALTALGTPPSGFTYELSGSDLLVKQGGTSVLKVTLNPVTGAFSVQQLAPADHPGPGADILSFAFTVALTDGDGDGATSTINFDLTDSVPSAGTNTAVTLDEDGLSGGNLAGSGDFNPASNGPIVSTGTLSALFGAYGPGAVSFAGMHGTSQTINGVSVSFTWNGGTNTLTANDGEGPVFTVLVNPATGAYTITQVSSLDHHTNALADNVETDATFTMSYTVTDGDNDTATGTLSLTIDDDTPTLGLIQTANINNAIGQTTTRAFTVNEGADGLGIASLLGNAAPAGLKSGGANVSYYVDAANPAVLIGYTGTTVTPPSVPPLANQVFKLTLTPGSDQYTFDLYKPIDGPLVPSSIDGSSSFGSGPTQAQILLAGTTAISVISGWLAPAIPADFNLAAWQGGAAASPLTLSAVNGSTAGWGVQNNTFNSAEFMRFDFGDADDFDGAGPYVAPAFSGPPVATATFDFTGFPPAATIHYVIRYNDGTISNGNFTGPGVRVLPPAPGSSTIDYVEFYSADAGNGNNRVDLTSVQNYSNGDPPNLVFNATVTDGDGDAVSGNITVDFNNPAVAPIINAPSIVYWSGDPASNVSPINRISFQDADSSGATVGVTLTMNDAGDDLVASAGGGVTVSGSGSNILQLTGTIANINAFIFAGSVQWNPTGSTNGDSGTLSISIDDNGATAGGNVTSTSVTIQEFNPNFSGDSNVDLSGVNVDNQTTAPNGGSGNDTIITSWVHQDTAAVTYDGGGGTDTITLVFTPDQLAEILDSTSDQNDLRDYLANPNGTQPLVLSDLGWNADVNNFDTVNIALATGYGVGTFGINAAAKPLPVEVGAPTAGDDLVVGTTSTVTGDTLTGLGGDDILVGLAGNDNLNGGANNDLLIGGDGDDTLTGSTGNDVLSGGRGFDSFVFSGTGATDRDTIVDYSHAEGDVIDLSALLNPNFGPTSIVSDFVSLQQAGDDVLVQVDLDGIIGGANFVDVTQLENYGSANQDPVKLFFENSNHLLFA